MSEKVVRYVTWGVFGLTVTLFSMVIGWLFYANTATAAKVDEYSTKESITQSQLSQIQTDLKWLIQLQNKK